jgi:hypothetical protein
MSVVEAIFLCPGAQGLRVLGVQGKLLAEEKMSLARRSARVYCFPADPASAPPAG